MDATTPSSSGSATVAAFDYFRQDLDDYNDRRERLIKGSRDITNLSKKVVFLLHRVITEDGDDGDDTNKRAAKRAGERLREIQNMFYKLRDELSADEFWRHQRTISAGIQEYIEALSFAHYLEHGTLIKYDQAQNTFLDINGVAYLHLTVEDYLLGLSDLTGELMRFAISGIGRRGGRAKAREVCTFVRNCKADFERLTPYVKELSRKQRVTAQSLEKIEDAVYAIVVRGSEYDLPPDMLDDIIERSISNFGKNSKRGRRDDSSDDGRDDF